MGSIGLGFAGVGLLGQTMIEQVPKVPGLHLAAVQDANLVVASKVAERYSSPWHGQRFDDLLELPAVDAVVISTPNAFHIPQAQAALRAGKQVLVQKPLAVRAADARATVELAAALGRILFVDYSYRYLETLEAMRTARPEIGAVRSVAAAFHNVHGPGTDRAWFVDPKLSGGGAMIDLGVHMLDMLLWVLQPRDVRLERATLDRRPGLEVEHGAHLELRMDQVPVTLDVSWDAPLPSTEISIAADGANGKLRWHNVDGTFTHFRTELEERVLIDLQKSLRENTLHAFAAAVERGVAPTFDTRVYDVLDQAYGKV